MGLMNLFCAAVLSLPVTHARGNPYCGKSASDFPIGVVPACPEGFLMNVDCANSCKSTYKAQMVANYDTACASYDTAYNGLLDDLEIYATDFANCIAGGADPADCRTIYRDQCQSALDTFETRKLAIQTILGSSNTSAYTSLFFCVFNCCEPE